MSPLYNTVSAVKLKAYALGSVPHKRKPKTSTYFLSKILTAKDNSVQAEAASVNTKKFLFEIPYCFRYGKYNHIHLIKQSRNNNGKSAIIVVICIHLMQFAELLFLLISDSLK